jgi:isoleucyl-tRNA synthetase
MALARRLADLGRSARSAAGVRTRQPLSRALADAPGFASLPGPLRALVAEELNVHSLLPLASSGTVMTYTVKPQFRSLGKRFGSSTRAVATALAALDPSSVAAAVASGASVSVDVAALGTVALEPSDVIVTQTPLAGWEVATAGGETVALDLTESPALRGEGIARDVIRLLQDARKSSGLQISDRIRVRWQTQDPQVSEALTAYAELISGEVLATEFSDGGARGGDEWREFADADLGLRLWVSRSRHDYAGS